MLWACPRYLPPVCRKILYLPPGLLGSRSVFSAAYRRYLLTITSLPFPNPCCWARPLWLLRVLSCTSCSIAGQNLEAGMLPVSDKGKKLSWRIGRRFNRFHFLNDSRYLFLLLGVLSQLLLVLGLLTCGSLCESLLTPAGFYLNASKKTGLWAVG